MSWHAGREEEYLHASIMEWSVTKVICGIDTTMIIFNQHLDHFKVAIPAWEQDINNNQTVTSLSVIQLGSV